MFAAGDLQPLSLDIPTLAFVAVCIAGFLGLLLILAWLQQRDVGALAWWGSAYLVGASAIALWGAPAPLYRVPQEVPEALIAVACGMIWSGVRLFHGRKLMPVAAFSGALLWLILSRLPGIEGDAGMRTALGGIVVGVYTFFIAFELSRERRKSVYSRTAAIAVPCLYSAMFLMPLAMRSFMPDVFAARWLTVFAVETIIYAVGTAFIVMLMVKDQHVLFYRTAATTDHLTGLLNRGAFLDGARNLCALQGHAGGPVTLMMFDLDHFKRVNDTFGHAAGDDVLRVFSTVARSSMRASDIVGRLGGEEFAAIVPEAEEVAARIAERLRANFEKAGVAVGGHAIGATVSIGTATAHEYVADIDVLIARADAALYEAKHGGRNRVQAALEAPAGIHAGRVGGVPPPSLKPARPAKNAAPKVAGEAATARLLYRR
jgi:diguanylate cyclase (GGDEF)-like protein